MHQLQRTGLTVAAVAAVGAAFVAGTQVGGLGTPAGPAPTGPGHRQVVGHDPVRLVNADLRPATSCDALLQWYVERGVAQVTPWGWTDARIYTFADAGGAEAPLPASTRSSASGTGTNVQEEGVDEPDLVKTDGRRLVRVLDDSTLVLYDVTGPEPVWLGSLPLTGVDAPELLLAGDRVVVVGHGQDVAPGRVGPGTVVLVVDVSDPAAPSLVRRATYDTELVTARQHGDVIRLVVSVGLPQLDFVEPGLLRREQTALAKNQAIVRASSIAAWLPHVTVVGADGTSTTSRLLDCEDVSIPAADAGLGTVAVVGFDAADPESPEVTAVSTSSETVYVSDDQLYLASSAYRSGWGTCCWDVPQVPSSTGDDGTTYLYGFDLDGAATTYAASGEVDGSIASRWSMDEYDGVLRVAVGPTLRTGSFNSVITLSRSGTGLVEVGRVDGLGVNEEIKSMRWFDGLAVMVTFRQTDPFYAIDLSEASAPRLLGTLKLPGFSSYLHPLGSHRMLGIGSAADPSTGVTTGAKTSLFDVSDVTAPRELDTVSYSPGSTAQVALDPRQFTWLPDRRTALTVISEGFEGRTGYVSVLRIDESQVTNEMVPVEYGVEVDDVRLVPLADGRVVLVTGDAVSFFDV